MPGRWIRFALGPKQNPKTSIWLVIAKDGDMPLGEIRWWGRWRKYAFFPNPETLYENTCLRDIAEFIESAMVHRVRK